MQAPSATQPSSAPPSPSPSQPVGPPYPDDYEAGGKLVKYARDYSLSASIEGDPRTVVLRWRGIKGDLSLIERRRWNADKWEVLEENYAPWSYTNAPTAIDRGARYEFRVRRESKDSENLKNTEYELFDRYLVSGIDLPIRHHRGKALVLVDETVMPELKDALAQLESDLIGDGWRVEMHPVPRHDDSTWTNNIPKIRQVKSVVEAEYKEAPETLKSVFLIGHVPIPHSGQFNPDGHHTRPWPVDFYYGDTIHGPNDWTDEKTHSGRKDQLRGFKPIPNVPGDGKFDQKGFPSPVELAVGRVDFANMPTLTQNPPDGINPVSEVALLRRYLEKNHRYRHHQLTFPNRVAVLGFFGGGFGDSNRLVYSQAWKNASAWFGMGKSIIHDINHFKTSDRFLWGFQFGAGLFDRIGVGNPANNHRTSDLANPSNPHSTGFHTLDGSYFGEWDTEDNFLRATLAPEEAGLAALWGRWYKQRCQSMAWGDSLGKTVVRTINHLDDRDYVLHAMSANIHLGIMGDPTLRLFVAPPPNNATAIRKVDQVTLQWEAPEAPGRSPQYFVYRSDNGLKGEFQLLNDHLLQATQFTDPEPGSDTPLYQIRAAYRHITGSGVFTNLSQAVFVSP